MPGQPLEQINLQTVISGNTILLPAIPRTRYKIFTFTLSSTADITGEVLVYISNKIIYAVQNPKTGAAYGFNLNPNFIQSDENSNLIINVPATITLDINIAYEKAP